MAAYKEGGSVSIGNVLVEDGIISGSATIAPVEALLPGDNYVYVVISSQDGQCGDSREFTFTVTGNPNARNYYWTWYDNVNAADWVLMANPADSGLNLFLDLAITGQKRDLAPFSLNGIGCSSLTGGVCEPGQVPAGRSLTPRFDGVMGGPVKVSSFTGEQALVSQRILWAGNSLEEVVGVEEERLSSHYYWTWYDQKSLGYTDWVLVANPGDAEVYYEISIGDQDLSGYPGASGTIQPGENVTPTFPGVMGGPVEVKAWSDASKTTPAKVMASQRVLSGYGAAFNEMPGIPAEELSDHYLWTWYDNTSPGARDWVLIANPNDHDIYYEITIAGASIAGASGASSSAGTIAPGKNVTPTFPLQDGPVEVRTWKDASKSEPADAIASQRIIWGPSFSETPGYPYESLTDSYHWTWYDQQSLGMTDWVLIANPGDQSVYYEVSVAGTVEQSGTIAANDKITPTFDNLMGDRKSVV